MPGTKDFYFEPAALLGLLTHYTDGIVPMNGEVMEFLLHPSMKRKIGLAVASDEWTTMDPLFLGYDGRRVMSWSKEFGGDTKWEQRNETPQRQ